MHIDVAMSFRVALHPNEVVPRAFIECEDRKAGGADSRNRRHAPARHAALSWWAAIWTRPMELGGRHDECRDRNARPGSLALRAGNKTPRSHRPIRLRRLALLFVLYVADYFGSPPSGTSNIIWSGIPFEFVFEFVALEPPRPHDRHRVPLDSSQQ